MEESEIKEKQLLEQKLRTALEEAWAKANAALEEESKNEEASDVKVRLAAEAADYSSLLYSLTYGLEDADPPSKVMRGMEYSSLVKQSVEALRLVREQNPTKPEETYGVLRTAADGFRTAYLSRIRKREKKPSQL